MWRTGGDLSSSSFAMWTNRLDLATTDGQRALAGPGAFPNPGEVSPAFEAKGGRSTIHTSQCLENQPFQRQRRPPRGIVGVRAVLAAVLVANFLPSAHRTTQRHSMQIRSERQLPPLQTFSRWGTHRGRPKTGSKAAGSRTRLSSVQCSRCGRRCPARSSSLPTSARRQRAAGLTPPRSSERQLFAARARCRFSHSTCFPLAFSFR